MENPRVASIPQSLSTEKEKLNTIDNELTEMSKHIVEHDSQLVEGQVNKIESSIEAIRSILSKIEGFKDDCEETIKELSREIAELKKKIGDYDGDHDSRDREEEYEQRIQANKKQYLSDWKKRIEVAQGINVDKLAELDLYDRRSKANEVFKWIIVVIYGESESKYYWPNFKHEVFVRDEGVDFRERLGKINASSAKEEQKIKTQVFLRLFDEIVSCKELASAAEEVEQIREVARIFLSCYKKAQEVRDLEAKIQKSKEKNQATDEQCLRAKARVEALEDRITTNKDYLAVLEQIEDRLKEKPRHYAEKETVAKEIVEQIKKTHSSELAIDIGSEKRDNCECSIY